MKNWDDILLAHEQARGSCFYFIVHPTGSPGNISDALIESLRKDRTRIRPDCKKVDIILHSPGGYADTAYRTMKYFRSHFEVVNVVVPLYAKSAASLMCLGADQILMGEFSELGPIDVQIHDPLEQGSRPISPLDDFQSMEFLKEYATKLLDDYTMLVLQRSGMSVKEAIQTSTPYVTEMMKPLLEGVNPFEVGGHYRALNIGAEYAKRLLKLTRNGNAEEITQKLVWEYPSHDFAIDIDECAEIGLPVTKLDLAIERDLVDFIDYISDTGKPLHGFLAATNIHKRESHHDKGAKKTNTPHTKANSADEATQPLPTKAGSDSARDIGSPKGAKRETTRQHNSIHGESVAAD